MREAARLGEVAGHFAEMVEAIERLPDLQIWNLCFFHSLLAGLPNVNPLMERFADGAFRIAAASLASRRPSE